MFDIQTDTLNWVVLHMIVVGFITLRQYVPFLFWFSLWHSELYSDLWTMNSYKICCSLILILMSSIECNSFIDSDNVYVLRSWNSTLNWLNECGKDWRIISTWDSRAPFFFVMFFVPPLFLWPLFYARNGSNPLSIFH